MATNLVPADVAGGLELNKAPLHIDAGTVWEDLGLDAPRPVLQPPSPIGQDREPSEQEVGFQAHVRQGVIHKEVTLD